MTEKSGTGYSGAMKTVSRLGIFLISLSFMLFSSVQAVSNLKFDLKKSQDAGTVCESTVRNGSKWKTEAPVCISVSDNHSSGTSFSSHAAVVFLPLSVCIFFLAGCSIVNRCCYIAFVLTKYKKSILFLQLLKK